MSGRPPVRRRSIRRRLVVLAVGAALAGGCTADPAAGPLGPPRTDRVRTAPPPKVWGTGPADLGLKWNMFLQPPLAYAARLGSGVTFTEVEWCPVQAVGPAGAMDQIDKALTQAHDVGFTLMVKLRAGDCDGSPPVTDPADGLSKSPSRLPKDPELYREWIDTVVRHYARRGVHIWAVENEVDAANFWAGSPQDYTDVAKLAIATIRQADPESFVLDAGISSSGYGVAMAGELVDAGRGAEALTLYQAYYARRQTGGTARFPAVADEAALRKVLSGERAVAARAMVAANWALVNDGLVDAYQLHFYEDPAVLPHVLQYLDNHLDVPIPIQAWEVGTAWPGANYSETRHAQKVAHVVGLLLARKVSPVVYLPLAFTPRTGKTQVFRGLVTADGTILESGRVFARLAAAIAQSSSIKALNSPDGQLIGALLLGPDASLAVTWAAGAEPALHDLPGGADAALTDLNSRIGLAVTAN